jgi:diguanylate cyclase (GGDEF)-like protein
MRNARSAVNLLIFQAIYLVLISATIALCFFVDREERLLFYLLLLSGLGMMVLGSLILNIRGRYRASVWITSACMILGPWLSILFDPSVFRGDFVPLVYVGLSVQLCAILLNKRATLVVALAHLGGVIAAIAFNSALQAINWPSLVTYIIFTAVVGIAYAFTNNRQLDEIEKQRNQLMLDEAKLRDLSVRDSLTGLFNRRYMEETFDREIKRAIRKEHPLSVIMADVDGFKAINDSVGHVLGDEMLTKIAAFLLISVRASDVVCRFGGDEFCLIMPDCSLEEGIARANALCRGVRDVPIARKEYGIESVTLSFGVAAMPGNGSTREELINAADSAMYASKHAGRNCVNGAGPDNPPIPA